MPNRLSLSDTAFEALQQAGAEGCEELIRCLEYVRDNPEPDENLIIAHDRPPLVI